MLNEAPTTPPNLKPGQSSPNLYSTISTSPAVAIRQSIEEITRHSLDIWVEFNFPSQPQVFLLELDERWGANGLYDGSGVCIAPGYWLSGRSGRPGQYFIGQILDFITQHVDEHPMRTQLCWMLLTALLYLFFSQTHRTQGAYLAVSYDRGAVGPSTTHVHPAAVAPRSEPTEARQRETERIVMQEPSGVGRMSVDPDTLSQVFSHPGPGHGT
ncbi:hypothetical protein RhiJN_16510 [Ceratobasidium sp. AG-Ba]|nr:hypothetical protein RhiJN_16510 [Ceratobasidium sp. AG-Ba]